MGFCILYTGKSTYAARASKNIISIFKNTSKIERYSGLADSEKKRLELDEDRILATLLHNLTAYLVMCGAPTKMLQQVKI